MDIIIGEKKKTYNKKLCIFFYEKEEKEEGFTKKLQFSLLFLVHHTLYVFL